MTTTQDRIADHINKRLHTRMEKEIAAILIRRREMMIQRAIASQMPHVTFTSKIAVASTNHPLQKRIEATLLTLDIANGNRQGVKATETDNILSTAMYAPIKINLATGSHHGAKPIGTLSHVERKDNNIVGNGVVWLNDDTELQDYFNDSSELFGSFEMYYQTSNKDEQGVSWLESCIFAGFCLVDLPAYKETRVRVV